MPAFLWFSLIWNSTAQAGNPFRVEVLPVTAALEQEGAISVVFVVPEDHHLYVDMMSVTAAPSRELNIQAPQFPMGNLKPDPASPEQMREIYQQSTTVTLPIKPSAQGIYPAKIEVRYQGCKEGLCYMPKTETIETSVVVNTSSPVKDMGAPNPAQPDEK